MHRTAFVSMRWPFGLAIAVVILLPSASPAQWKERATLKGHKDVGSVAFSPDGKILATAGAGGVRFWDPESGTVQRSIEAYGAMGAVGVMARTKLCAAPAAIFVGALGRPVI